MELNELTKIKKVYEIGAHMYDDTQGEFAFRCLLENGRRCWMVGYGSDLMPASKNDLINITDKKKISKKDDGSEAWELAQANIGTTVHSYRN